MSRRVDLTSRDGVTLDGESHVHPGCVEDVVGDAHRVGYRGETAVLGRRWRLCKQCGGEGEKEKKLIDILAEDEEPAR